MEMDIWREDGSRLSKGLCQIMNEFNQVRYDFDVLDALKAHKLETQHLRHLLEDPNQKEAHKIRLYYITKWCNDNQTIDNTETQKIRNRYKL